MSAPRLDGMEGTVQSKTTLTENRRGDCYIVDAGATYVMLHFDGTEWAAVEMSRPFDPNKRHILYSTRAIDTKEPR